MISFWKIIVAFAIACIFILLLSRNAVGSPVTHEATSSANTASSSATAQPSASSSSPLK